MPKDKTNFTPQTSPDRVGNGANDLDTSAATKKLKLNQFMYARAPYETQMEILTILLDSLCNATTITQDVPSVARHSARNIRDITDRSSLSKYSVRNSIRLMVKSESVAIAQNHPMGRAYYIRKNGLLMLPIGMERGWVDIKWKDQIAAASDWVTAIEVYQLRMEREDWQSKQKADRPKARTPLNQQQVVIQEEPEIDYPTPQIIE